MDFMGMPSELMAMASTMLLLLLSAHRSLDCPPFHDNEGDDDNSLVQMTEFPENSTVDIESVTRATLHTFRLSNVFSLLDDDLGYWVKPRSTAWFSRFLLDQYDDERWVTMFRMTKPAMHTLAAILTPTVAKKNTKYRLAIPVLV